MSFRSLSWTMTWFHTWKVWTWTMLSRFASASVKWPTTDSMAESWRNHSRSTSRLNWRSYLMLTITSGSKKSNSTRKQERMIRRSRLIPLRSLHIKLCACQIKERISTELHTSINNLSSFSKEWKLNALQTIGSSNLSCSTWQKIKLIICTCSEYNIKCWCNHRVQLKVKTNHN